MKKVSESVKVVGLDAGPIYKNLGIDDIVAISGLYTMKMGTLEDCASEGVDRKQVEVIHKESTKRGHASLTTTPAFFFELEGSRVIDLYGSTFPFGSYIIFSSRRIQVDDNRLIMPDGLPAGTGGSLKKVLGIYNRMWDADQKDQGRKVLPLGFYSRGFFKFSAEDLIAITRDARNPAMPLEIGLVSEGMNRFFEANAPSLFRTAMERESSLAYHHPNLFHEGRSREIEEGLDVWKSRHFDDYVREFKEKKRPTGDAWKQLAVNVLDLIMVRTGLTSSIAVWNELKRHRTAVQKVESVYLAADRAFDELNSLGKGEVPKWIHTPPSAGDDYLPAVLDMLGEYHGLCDRFEKRDAVYLVPHSVKVTGAYVLNGFHLLDPFGLIGVRDCTTSDYEVQAIVRELSGEIVNQVPALDGLLGPKCKTGVCPERQSCGRVEKYKRD